MTANEIFEKSKNCVGEITTYAKNGSSVALGTGFTYSADGKILTNYHVIEDAYSAKIVINGVTYDVQSVLAYDKEIDLAVLKVNATGLSVLTLSDQENAVGDSVYAFGSSKGLTATFSQGIITHADREMEGVHYVQHDAAISSGNSGGPLIDKRGEVIGINTMTIKDSQNLNFAISIKELSKLNFSTPLTFTQFYEKECDVFTKIKNYIIQNGEYDYSDKEYDLNFGYRTSSSLLYQTGAIYDTVDDEIDLTLYLKSDSIDVMVFCTIDEIDGVYEWSYIDDDSRYMRGTIYGNLFHSNYTLTYNYYLNISTASLRSSIKELSSSMMSLLLTHIALDYSDIGITASDLGFIYY